MDMNKKRVVKFSFWFLNILVILLLIWSLANYTFLNKEVTQLIQVGGIVAMIFLVILLEGAPVFIGSSVVVASVLAMNILNPWLVLWLFLVSAILGNIIYYYLGYFFGIKVLKYFEEKDVRKYKKLFKKYGGITMITMAISPIPYLPTLAGVFRMKSGSLISKILILRLLRHSVVFFIWLFILTRF